MNQDVRHTIKACAVGAGIAVLGCAILAWPSYRTAMHLRREIDSLEYRTAISPATADEERRLRAEVEARRVEIARECREVPDSPMVAEIVHRLSLPQDGFHVIDQTFTAGSSGPAGSDASWPERAMPVTIDLRGTFDSGFTLIRAVERMDRLLRITSVHFEADRRDDARPVPMVRMTLGVEAIYAPRERSPEGAR